MKSTELWKPGKYVRKNGQLRASRDVQEISVGSRLVGDLTARFYASAIPRMAKGRLADLGCGKVPLYETYVDYVDSVTCADWQAPESGPDHLDVSCDLGKTLPFEDNSFDTVILSDVMEHVPDPGLLWAELSRILVSGGSLIMNTPFMYCLHEQPHDYHRFTSHALRRAAESNGFEDIQICALGGTPEVLADIRAKHLQFIPLIGRPMASLLQALTWWFVNTGPGKRLSERTSEAFPLSYGLLAKNR